jgi:predicted ribosomally synthesized peptide with SipW-like signal peptide
MPSKKLLTGGAAIAIAMVLAGVGVFAVFTDTDSTGVAIDTGQLDIVAANDITATDIAPGDHIFREITVDLPAATNDGNLVASVDVDTTLGTDTAPNGGSLWSGADGLQGRFAICDGGVWTLPAVDDPLLGDTAPADGLDDSVTCSGTIIVQAEEPVNTLTIAGNLTAADFGVAPTATGTIPDGSTFSILAQLRLPTTADNTYEDASVTFDFNFDAIQRTGVNR